jgi:hypothetical protein
LLLLAGIGFQTVWEHRRHLAGMAGLVVAAAGGLYLVHAATAVAYDHPADPAEILVFTQTSTDAKSVRDQVFAINQRVMAATGQPLQMDVDSWGGASFPWAWYLRDLPVANFPDMSSPDYIPTAQSLLIADPDRERLLPQLESYTGYPFRLRVWWTQEYARAGPREWLRWLVWRKPWNPEGSLVEWLYVRNDLPGARIVAITRTGG